MNPIVRKLAIDHLKWNKKKTFLEILIITLISASVFMVNLTVPRIRNIYRSWCAERYGTWYAFAEIPDESLQLTRMILDQDAADGRRDLRPAEERTGPVSESDYLHYGWLYHQGTWNDYTIGHADPWLYELCRLDLTEGSFPSSENEIVISEEVRDSDDLGIGNTITLSVNDTEKEYTVTGILHKSQDLFPDIYTAVEGGHAYYFFDRMFSYYSSSTKTIELASFGLTVPYTENRYGYDHYTKLNDEFRYYKETTAFDDNAMIRLITLLSAALFLFLIRTAGGKKRAKELTVLRAAGMTSVQVISMVMLETLITGAAGTVSGLVLGFLLTEAADAWMILVMHISAEPLWLDYLGNPGLCAGLGALVLLFCFTGTWLPVLRASQNALSGSFEEVYQGKNRKHRTKLQYMNTQRRAFRRLNNRKGFWAGMSVLAAFLCVIFLPEKQNDSFEASGMVRGVYQFSFDSMHYVSVNGEVSDESLLKALPGEVKYFEAGGLGELEYLASGSPDRTYLISISGGFIVLDEDSAGKMNYTGKLPENDHEIMLVSDHCGLTEIRNTDEYWAVDFQAAIGDRVVMNNEEYTICGLIEPSEESDLKLSDGSFLHAALYPIGNTSAVLLPQTVSHLGLETHTVTQLRFSNPQEKIQILSLLAENGIDLSMIDVSDQTVFFDSYDTRFLSVHLSWHMAAIPFVLGIIVSALLLALDTQADRRELIILKCLGMSRAQLSAEQFCQAVYTALSSVILLIMYGLLRFLAKEPWKVPLWVFPIELMISIAVFSLIYSAVLTAAGKLSFETMEE